jgi:LAS superfamily LD-carboxypeptidase LdcB
MKPSSTSPATLVGQTDAHLCSATDAESLGVRMHRDAVDPFIQLRAEAQAAGFELAILSGFRSFEQQLSIWNRKATGKLAVLGSDARPLNIATLSEEELVFSILRWSALPGASRHHWGTDLDIYDIAAKPEGYEVELIPEEVDAGGMFAPLHEWLDQRIADDTACGFFRPYDIDRHGVAPERWHLSYAPVASVYARMLIPELLRTTIEQADMMLKEVVLAHLDTIFGRFVINTKQALG